METLELFENKNNEIKRINYTSEILIFYINNINIEGNKISLLDKEELKKLDKIHDNNINNLSDNSITNLLNITISTEENKNTDSQIGNRINKEKNIQPNSDELILSDEEEFNCLNDDLD